jgi:hypothetical protein
LTKPGVRFCDECCPGLVLELFEASALQSSHHG